MARSAAVFWVAAAALAAVTALAAARLVGQAEASAARYGSLRPVVVSTRPIEMGAVLRATDVEISLVPATFLPDDHVGAAAEAVGRTVVVGLFPGLPVVRGHLAPEGVRGVAALLPPGTRAVAVPAGGASAPVHTGDLVDVLATFDPTSSDTGDPTFAVATAALVVDVAEDSVTVAVAPDEARRVAFAVAHGLVTLAVTSPLSGTSTPATPEPTPRPPPGTPRRG
ncbi:MAG: Flp pilus assembly protein CpaB [Actinomycetota bacterium]|nr:Flp pilus assembly protein CpaB [Actinomycetota bacterium]